MPLSHQRSYTFPASGNDIGARTEVEHGAKKTAKDTLGVGRRREREADGMVKGPNVATPVQRTQPHPRTEHEGEASGEEVNEDTGSCASTISPGASDDSGDEDEDAGKQDHEKGDEETWAEWMKRTARMAESAMKKRT